MRSDQTLKCGCRRAKTCINGVLETSKNIPHSCLKNLVSIPKRRLFTIDFPCVMKGVSKLYKYFNAGMDEPARILEETSNAVYISLVHKNEVSVYVEEFANSIAWPINSAVAIIITVE